METIQQTMVREHITNLLREGEALRAERHRTAIDDATEDDVGTRTSAERTRPARVRVGHWLIGVGTALAGTADRSGDAAGHAA
jgi:hypothetical protein